MTEKSLKNDEIDLIELISILWKKKLWIMLSSFILLLLPVFMRLQQKNNGHQVQKLSHQEPWILAIILAFVKNIHVF